MMSSNVISVLTRLVISSFQVSNSSQLEFACLRSRSRLKTSRSKSRSWSRVLMVKVLVLVSVSTILPRSWSWSWRKGLGLVARGRDHDRAQKITIHFCSVIGNWDKRIIFWMKHWFSSPARDATPSKIFQDLGKLTAVLGSSQRNCKLGRILGNLIKIIKMFNI